MVRVVQDMLGILQKEIFIRKIKKINYNIDTHEILRFASETRGSGEPVSLT
jgi:hypothetical protein